MGSSPIASTINNERMIVIKVRKAIFTWKRIEKDPIDFQNMIRLDVAFELGNDKPVIFIDAGSVKIEDRSLTIDVKEILKKLGDIDFDALYDVNVPSEYSGDAWELMINDKLYKGVLADPHYVRKVKKVIRFNAIQVYAEKKLASYVKS